MNTIIDNYINGNLVDAKKQAKRMLWSDLFHALMTDYGKSREAAIAISSYLKGEGSFQAACDADKIGLPGLTGDGWPGLKRGNI